MVVGYPLFAICHLLHFARFEGLVENVGGEDCAADKEDAADDERDEPDAACEEERDADEADARSGTHDGDDGEPHLPPRHRFLSGDGTGLTVDHDLERFVAEAIGGDEDGQQNVSPRFIGEVGFHAEAAHVR